MLRCAAPRPYNALGCVASFGVVSRRRKDDPRATEQVCGDLRTAYQLYESSEPRP
eukprot:CAMPEP_0201239258 /NCGR_PEP_ID=MMETSP0852-20130820/23869_1 /ASSEMBLY_ACC=CAM_ASM_000632 /TAXON_ID=183588 /ORGANISM="Pseudo-nitzschia fraudulenta, Strain WWA7" /LENGTH=54 /DNA_ID=CAMNT_0047534579 /DNA_START=71 /DNA_END=231 /DNA_ORIENTATION=+